MGDVRDVQLLDYPVRVPQPSPTLAKSPVQKNHQRFLVRDQFEQHEIPGSPDETMALQGIQTHKIQPGLTNINQYQPISTNINHIQPRSRIF